MDITDIKNKRDIGCWFDDEFNRRMRPHATEINSLKRELSQTVDVLQTVRQELVQAQHEILNLQKAAKRS